MKLFYKGRDTWGDRPVYEDGNGRLWKDVDPRPHVQPRLCTALNNSFDGEPDTPIDYIPRYKDEHIEFIPKRETW